MPIIIKLTQENGSPIWVNAAHILYMKYTNPCGAKPPNKKLTDITTAAGKWIFTVTETPEEINMLIVERSKIFRD